jgi:hypothetical protein
MFKFIKNYFKNRRERKIRERLVLNMGTYSRRNIDELYKFILTGNFE